LLTLKVANASVRCVWRAKVTDLEMMRKAAEDDVTALLGFADELCDANHPHAAELADLARTACETDDMATATFAVAVFFELLKK
jgi:hypothetical protein